MRISRLLMPAVTLAGALALAGCGGGSDSPMGDKKGNGDCPEDHERNTDGQCELTAAGKKKLEEAGATAEKNKQNAEQAEADAKALYGAINPNSASPHPDGARTNPAERVALTSAQRDNFKKAAGVTVTALGDWKGGHYTRTDDDGKVTGELRVYDSKGDAEQTDFADVYALVASGAAQGRLAFDANDAGSPYDKIKGIGLAGGGTTDDLRPNQTGEYKVRGTFDGAGGEYICTADAACTVITNDKGEVQTLNGTWQFDPDTGAQVPKGGTGYLEFGWWIEKDATGEVTRADAFFRDAASPTTRVAEGDLPTSASAKYEGHAAGKYAMQKSPAGAADHGHFTADAMLTAEFSGGTSKLKGTVDGFRLNDGTADPGWTVTLKESGDPSSGVFRGVTVWAIDEIDGGEDGDWNASLYGTLKGTTNIPAHAAGDFGAEYRGTGRMVGAFGAEHSAN